MLSLETRIWFLLLTFTTNRLQSLLASKPLRDYNLNNGSQSNLSKATRPEVSKVTTPMPSVCGRSKPLFSVVAALLKLFTHCSGNCSDLANHWVSEILHCGEVRMSYLFHRKDALKAFY